MAITTTKGVAEALGLSRRTIRAYAAEGRIPFTVTPGGHRRFDVQAVRSALYPHRPRQTASMALLRHRRPEIVAAAARCGAHNVRIFGSVATGNADSQSDIDFLVTLEPGRSYADIEDLCRSLEELLEHPVDILTEGACHGRFAEVAQQAVEL